MSLLSNHRPIIRHAGDQRDPIEQISCSCKKEGYTIKELEISYFIHLFDILRTPIAGLVSDTGR